jgi:hypothetical protein
MADPQAPAPPPPPAPPEVPWWRRVAQFAGVDDEIDAVTGAAQTASDWFQSKVSPEFRAKMAAFEQEAQQREAARQAQNEATWNRIADPVKRFFGSAPVQQVGQEFADRYRPLWTPPADIAASGARAQQAITQRSDQLRQQLPQTPALKPLDWMLAAQHDWLPNALVGQAVDASSPVGAVSNLDLPVGPALHAAAPVLAKLAGGAAHLAGGLPPGFYSRVDRIAEQVGKKGIHPNKLAALLKSGASGEEVAYRRINDLIAGKGEQLISKAELEAHLAAHPPPEIRRTNLGASEPKLTELPAGYSIQPLAMSEQVPGRGTYTLVGPDRVGRKLHAESPEDAERLALVMLNNARPPNEPVRHSSLVLPGGEQYRETLLQLQRPPAPPHPRVKELEAQLTALTDQRQQLRAALPRNAPHDAMLAMEAQYAHLTDEMEDILREIHQHNAAQPRVPPYVKASHYNEPNILTHQRSTERVLPSSVPPTLPEGYQLEQDARGKFYYRLPDGTAEGPDYATADQALRGAMEHAAAAAPAPTGRQLAQQGWTVRVDREDPFNGTRQMTILDPEGNFAGTRGMTRLTPEEYLHETAIDRAKQAAAAAPTPTGERGRFLEEVQSDWHQAGKEQGYHDPVRHAAALRELQMHRPEAREILRRADNLGFDNTGQALQAVRNHDDYATRWDLGDLLPEDLQVLEDYRAAYREAQATDPTQTVGVPDAPFKETWQDLALKTQLLDVANRRDLSWLGFTTGKTQAERYDLAKYVSKLEYDPHEGRLVGYDHGGAQVVDQVVNPEDLDEHIGKEAADKLRQQIEPYAKARQWERAQWSVGHETTPEYFHIYDPNGEPLHTYDGALEWFKSEAEANARIDELVAESQDELRRSAQRDGDYRIPTLTGSDLQVGGLGMKSFYDQLLPRRLEKLLKPFGGTVERGSVPTTKREAVPGFTVRDDYGMMRGNFATREEAEAYIANPPPQMRDYVSAHGGARVESVVNGRTVERTVGEPAWIAHLSPEMKERIRRQGFPLMSFLPPAVVGGAAAAASQLGGSDDEQGGGAGTRALAAAAAAGLPLFPLHLPRGLAAEAGAAERAGLRAFHGSPHDFDRFDISKLGTGEGAQAYGHGLYFAEREGVAKSYRDSLAGARDRQVEGGGRLPNWVANRVEHARAGTTPANWPKGTVDELITEFKARIGEAEERVASQAPQYWNDESKLPGLREVLQGLENVKAGAAIAPAGRMYEVNLNVDPQQLLDWDAPLGQQSTPVRRALHGLGFEDWASLPTAETKQSWNAQNMPGENVYRAIGRDAPHGDARHEAAYAAEQLRNAGIPGIRYRDQQSRSLANVPYVEAQVADAQRQLAEWSAPGPGMDEVAAARRDTLEAQISYWQQLLEETRRAPAPTHNYTIFDDKLIDILRKYGILPPLAAGAAAASRLFPAPASSPPPPPPRDR